MLSVVPYHCLIDWLESNTVKSFWFNVRKNKEHNEEHHKRVFWILFACNTHTT